jgi:hypothetical protein
LIQTIATSSPSPVTHVQLIVSAYSSVRRFLRKPSPALCEREGTKERPSMAAVAHLGVEVPVATQWQCSSRAAIVAVE